MVTEVNAPKARASYTAVWSGKEMLIWDGINVSSVPDITPNGARYNPQTDSWLPISTVNAPPKRNAHTAIWSGKEMIIWGGATFQESAVTTGGRYNPETDDWQATSLVNAPAKRSDHTAVWTGQEMLVWGGTDQPGGKYNPVTDSWQPITIVNSPGVLYRHTAIWTGTEMIVWGGSANTNITNLGKRYNPTTDTWINMSNINNPTPRVTHSAIWTGTEMIIWGGQGDATSPRESRYLNTGGRYNPNKDVWLATSTTNVPRPRYLHTSIWTGIEMIIWGGTDMLGQSFETGARYNPATDNWQTTSLINAPQGRTLHTAIWSGKEMIIWGGKSFGTQGFNTGGRYSPINDSWKAMNNTSAPSARAQHTAIWSGKEMIVFGGINPAVNLLNSGGRYNPELDKWSPTTQIGAPSARLAHTTIWTGTEMVVWGGSEGFAFTNSGGRYFPENNIWLPITTTNAPSARVEHTAIWSGQEMIIWGGQGFETNLFNTGGRYTPSTNTWLPITTTNAPSARNNHTAVWTGAEMIIWGGAHILPVKDGARYDAISDSWKALTLTNAPVARTQHTAIWSGQVMIIYGGHTSSAPLSREARYAVNNPQQQNDFAFSIDRATQQITPGAIASYIISLPTNLTFSQGVELSYNIIATNDTSSIKPSFSASIIRPGEQVILTITADINTPRGDYVVSVIGKNGSITRSITTILTVIAPDFDIKFNPMMLTIQRGETVSVPINITRMGNFTNDITILAPDKTILKMFKLKITPSSQTTNGELINFNLKASNKAVIGTKPLVFVGLDNSGKVHSATLLLVIE